MSEPANGNEDPAAVLFGVGLGLLAAAAAASEAPPESRSLRLARRALNAAAAVGRTGELAERWGVDLAAWLDRYLAGVELDRLLGEADHASYQTLEAQAHARAMLAVYGLLPSGEIPLIPAGVVDPDLAAFAGEDAS
jgi:hypothetical protein